MKKFRINSNIFYEVFKYAIAMLAAVLLAVFLIRLQGQDVGAAGSALVYGAFDALLGNKFLDPEDNTARLAENLLKYKFFPP